MALLEVNLEKPALVEEYQYPGETTVGRTKPGEPSRGDTSGGGGARKLVGLLVALAGVGLLAWRLKTRGQTTEQASVADFESEEYERGSESEIGSEESGGGKRKVASVLGLAVALASVAAVVRKVRQ